MQIFQESTVHPKDSDNEELGLFREQVTDSTQNIVSKQAEALKSSKDIKQQPCNNKYEYLENTLQDPRLWYGNVKSMTGGYSNINDNTATYDSSR